MTIQEYRENHSEDDFLSERDERMHYELEKLQEKVENLQNELDDYKYYWNTLYEWVNSLVEKEKVESNINYQVELKGSEIAKKMAEIENGEIYGE